jgi:Arc/MetJ family transcription regulator
MYSNIDLDPNLVAQAMRLTGLRTKRALVEAGLQALILLHEQADVRDLRGRLQWKDDPAFPKEPAARTGKGERG